MTYKTRYISGWVIFSLTALIIIFFFNTQNEELKKSREKVKEYWSLYQKSIDESEVMRAEFDTYAAEYESDKAKLSKTIDDYRAQASRLRQKLKEFESPDFETLDDCREKYGRLYKNHKLSLRLHEENVQDITAGFRRQLENAEKRLEISGNLYASCISGQEALKNIIEEYRKRRGSKWGWFVGAGPYIGFSAGGLSFGAGVTLAYGRKWE